MTIAPPSDMGADSLGQSETPGPRANFTFGAELEWSDWDTDIPLPRGLGLLNPVEDDVCNSTGRAWDYRKEATRYGGEVNVQPTKTVDALIEYVDALAAITGPVITHRCRLDIHVGSEHLRHDLEAQKAILRYAWDNHDAVVERFPAPILNLDDFTGRDREAAKRYLSSMKRKMNSQARRTHASRFSAATTVDEFQDAHRGLVPTATGHRLLDLPRAWCNLESLAKHGTVEFRLFWGTLSGHEVGEAAEWAKMFLEHALGDGKPVPLWHEEYDWDFPPVPAYDADKEGFFQWTKRPIKPAVKARLEASHSRWYIPPED